MRFDLMIGNLAWAESARLAQSLEAAGFSGMLFAEASQVPWSTIAAAIAAPHLEFGTGSAVVFPRRSPGNWCAIPMDDSGSASAAKRGRTPCVAALRTSTGRAIAEQAAPRQAAAQRSMDGRLLPMSSRSCFRRPRRMPAAA